MTLGYADRPDAELRSLCIPGTHDSGSYAITGIDENVSQTVVWSLGEQLRQGFRYLDLRIAYRKDAFRMVHGISTSALAAEGVQDIRDFAFAHPQEILIIKIVLIGLDETQRRCLTDQLLWPQWGERMIEPLGLDLTFRQCWERDRNILVAWEGEDFDQHQAPYWKASDLIVEKWSNTADVGFLIQDQSQFIRTVDRQGKFHVAQIVLTPMVSTFFKYALSIEAMTGRELDQAAMIVLLDSEARKVGQKGNIMMVDFPETQKAYEACMGLNGVE